MSVAVLRDKCFAYFETISMLCLSCIVNVAPNVHTNRRAKWPSSRGSDPHFDQSTSILLLKICISTNGVTSILEFLIPHTMQFQTSHNPGMFCEAPHALVISGALKLLLVYMQLAALTHIHILLLWHFPSLFVCRQCNFVGALQLRIPFISGHHGHNFLYSERCSGQWNMLHSRIVSMHYEKLEAALSGYSYSVAMAFPCSVFIPT